TSLVNHGLNDSDDSEQTRRPPGDNQPYLEEARVVREPPVYISVRSKVPDIPLPPPPVARRVGVDYSLLDPVQGNFATLDSEFVMMHPHNRAKYSLDATTSTIVENQQLPPAVHKSGIHRSTNSLPVNVPFLSAPPADALLTVEPSAPPIAGRVRSFNSAGHMRRPSNDSGSRGIGRRVPPIHASASPPHDVRMAAIQDAHANLNRKMFSDKVLNFRDIGVSAIKAGIQLHQDKARAESVGPMPGVVFRSAELGSACEHDVKMLFSKYGIRTIIDLRSELEARASDIMMRHYPASIQPTADQSMEKLMKLRAMQLQNTIVEVAAHGYESAARPWEKTGESRASWSHRNSLRYSKSIGDPRKDPLARALVHLYDKVPEDDAQETQNITLDEPYVPLFVPPAETVYPPQRPAVPRKASFSAANSQLDVHHGHISYAKDSPTLDMSDVEASTLQHSGLAQSALDWGSETLQSLRSYWDQQWAGAAGRYRCNIIGENYRKRCVWAHTPWSTRIKVIWRFAIFNKAEAIRTIGREVLTPRGLAGSYEDYVDYCKEEFAAVMRIFADPCAYPILFHCQHGKDRTGIVAMLLLGILGVDEEVIAADYAQSQDNLAPVRKRMELLDMGAVGLPPSFCDSPTFVMRNLLRHINYNYGSVRGYLRSAGLKEQEINTIAWCLRGNFYGVVHEKSRKAHAEARRLYLHPSAARSAVIVSPSARGPLPPSSLQISRRESADWS
ncbi:hypothetical protein GGI01_003110, partial [Coemansia sp. RSA 376]